MGTGNYRHADGETVILDLYDDLHEDCGEDHDLLYLRSREAFQDFQTELKAVLDAQAGLGFTMDGKNWRGRSELILARGETFEAWSHEDSYGHVFLTIGLRQDIDADLEDIARASLPSVTARIFDALQQIYPLRVATSAWTSAPRQQAMALAA